MRIVKANAVLYAEPINDPVVAPGPGGEPKEIARPGDWAVWSETDEGFTFRAFMSEKEIREKHTTV